MSRQFGEKIRPHLADVSEEVSHFFDQGLRILFEGAQGTLLDVDHGTYPFVTSSNCVAAQAAIGTGIGPQRLNEILMVSKAYSTRVGKGPFFTEGEAWLQEQFRTIGNEFGATTGRAGRCGWLDLQALKYASRLNGATGLILTKVDILAALGFARVAVSYIFKGQALSFKEALDLHERGEQFEVKYKEIAHISPMPAQVSSLNDLPGGIQELCALIEEEVKIPIRMISYGPKRGQEVFINSEVPEFFGCS